MRILVCLKQVPDTNEVRMNDDFTLERDFVAQIINPADESALELGLQLRDSLGGEVTVLTMGPRRAESMLREALSRGADKAVLMTDKTFAGADTLVTAQCLSRCAKALGSFDLLIFGRRASDGETGQVGPMTASLMDIPCVSNITRAEGTEEGLTALQLTENGRKTWLLPLPAAVTLCEWSYRLRLPTLSGLRKAAQAEIQEITASSLGLTPPECGLKASPTRVVHVSARPVGVRPCEKLSVQELLERGLM